VGKEILVYQRTLPKELKQVIVISLGDVHVGNPNFSEKNFLKLIEQIKSDERYYLILNGDLIENINKDSVGDIFTQFLTPQAQIDYLIDHLSPIKHKILGMCDGNHEDRTYKKTGISISLNIARALECPYQSEAIYLWVSFGEGYNYDKSKSYNYVIYSTHGYGCARTEGAMMMQAVRLADSYECDVLCVGHLHKAMLTDNDRLAPSDRQIKTDDGFTARKTIAHNTKIIRSGAMVMHGGWAQKAGFKPVNISYPKIVLGGDGEKKSVSVVIGDLII
jgi:predicted phosphodiesterase